MAIVTNTIKNIWVNFTQSLKNPDEADAITDFTSFQKTLFFVVPHLIVGLLAYVLDYFQIKWFVPSCHWMQGIFPPIYYYAEKSDFYLMSLYYFTFDALLFPYYLLFCFLITYDYTIVQYESTKVNQSVKGAFMFLICLSLPLAGVYFGIFLNEGVQFDIFPVNKEKWALILMGWLLSISQTGFLLGGILVYILLYPLSFLNSNKRKIK